MKVLTKIYFIDFIKPQLQSVIYLFSFIGKRPSHFIVSFCFPRSLKLINHFSRCLTTTNSKSVKRLSLIIKTTTQYKIIIGLHSMNICHAILLPLIFKISIEMYSTPKKIVMRQNIIQFHCQFCITKSCFFLTNILLRKFDTSLKKRNEYNINQTC